MFVTGILSILSGVQERFRRDDDSIDRLHHRYTTILLVVFAVVSTTQQLVGEPIHCWAPKEFQSSWIKYTNQYCWVKNTYFLPFEENIPAKHEERDEIIYYQWIPFIFLGMAIFFYLPSLVWTSLNSKAGVDSDNILETAENFKRTDKLELKEKHLKLITNQFARFVGAPRTVGGITVKKRSTFIKNLFSMCGKKFGNYLVLLYIFTKLLYIINAFVQLHILNSVLETDFKVFGVEAIKDLMEDRDFLNHTIFPKVTMCDFEVRGLAHEARRYTVQCLLPINLYTEKMFIFLWFWMVMLLIMTCCSFLFWILHSVLPKDRYGFVETCLIIQDRIEPNSKHDDAVCYSFVHNYLRADGLFVLRMIDHNTNRLTASEVAASVWDNWRDKCAKSLDEPRWGETCAFDADKPNNRDKPANIDEPDFMGDDTVPMKSFPLLTKAQEANLSRPSRPSGLPPSPPPRPQFHPFRRTNSLSSPPLMASAPLSGYS